MFLNNLVNYIASHATVLLLTSMLLILILLILVVYTMVRLSSMRARYREMMRGSQSDDLEGMLLQHISAVEKVAATNARILEENELIRQFSARHSSAPRWCASVHSRIWAATSAMPSPCSMRTTTA